MLMLDLRPDSLLRVPVMAGMSPCIPRTSLIRGIA